MQEQVGSVQKEYVQTKRDQEKSLAEVQRLLARHATVEPVNNAQHPAAVNTESTSTEDAETVLNTMRDIILDSDTRLAGFTQRDSLLQADDIIDWYNMAVTNAAMLEEQLAQLKLREQSLLSKLHDSKHQSQQGSNLSDTSTMPEQTITDAELPLEQRSPDAQLKMQPEAASNALYHGTEVVFICIATHNAHPAARGNLIVR